MNYKYKLYIQKIISLLPSSDRINYLFQRFISKSIPLSDKLYFSKMEAALSHYNSFLKYRSDNLAVSNSSYYEFGAGWDLTFPLLMSVLTFKDIYCLDVKDLIFPHILNDSIARLTYLNDLGISYENRKHIIVNKNNYKNILSSEFRINYMAPKDAKKTNFPDSSIDFIVSHATLEHIPKNDIINIMLECNRIVKPSGVLSFEIDYADHFSYFDYSTNEYNFLKYSDKKFQYYNTKLLYQNRLRHRDYIKILKETGFEILEVTTKGGTDDDKAKISKINLDSYFKDNYSLEELMIKKSRIIFMKKT